MPVAFSIFFRMASSKQSSRCSTGIFTALAPWLSNSFMYSGPVSERILAVGMTRIRDCSPPHNSTNRCRIVLSFLRPSAPPMGIRYPRLFVIVGVAGIYKSSNWPLHTGIPSRIIHWPPASTCFALLVSSRQTRSASKPASILPLP